MDFLPDMIRRHPAEDNFSAARSEQADERRCLLVLGMHRSGTSALTRVLNLLGADLPATLAPPADDNETGFWESLRFVDYHDHLLSEAGSVWGDWRALDLNRISMVRRNEIKRKIAELVEEEYGASRFFVLKDPRICRFLPIYAELLTERGIVPSYVISLRNPLAVAASLTARNGLTIGFACLVWLGHVLEAERATRRARRVFVAYERMLSDWRGLIADMGRHLQIVWPNLPELAAAKIEKFLSRGLQHHAPSGDELEVHPEVPRWVKDTYVALLQLQKDPSAQAALLTLDNIRAEFEAVAPVFGEAVFKELAARERFQAKARNKQAQDAEAAVNARDGEIAELTKRVAAGAVEIERTHAELNARDGEIAELTKRVAAGAVEIERAHAELARIAVLKERLASLGRENSALQRLLKRERLTILRPMFRRGLLAAKLIARSLPHPARVLLHSAFYELVLRLAPKSDLAHQYYDFKRATRHASATIKAIDYRSGDSLLEDKVIQAARALESQGIDIFIFPIIDWDYRIQRPQHIAKCLARRGYRVFYFSTTFLPAGGPPFQIFDTPAEGVFLCKLSCPDPHPVIYSTLLNDKQRFWLAEAIRSLQDKFGRRPTVALLHWPLWRSVAVNISGATVVYDCMDYHAGFSNSLEDIQAEEKHLIQQADLVVTTSLGLSEHVGKTACNILIRNAAEIEFFADHPKDVLVRSPKLTVGYFGSIADWFDTELVQAAAEAFPDWEFLLIGSSAHATITNLTQLSNVRHLGEIPYGELPGYLHSFDVCIIPFKLNDLILHTNPVKLYEYLSAGKPVVATPLPELDILEHGLVHTAGTKEKFIEKLSIGMAERDDISKINWRKNWAARQTWDDRAQQFDQAIRSCFPKVSVIVLCYNNLDMTKACLAGLDRFTLYPDWELIVVDNASQDRTAAYLSEYAATRPWVRVVANKENLGFSRGNNVGLREANGEYLVMLNNDTYVTQGWLVDLIRHLRKNANLGLVGPVTNNIGNEAKIDISYSNMNEMEEEARRYTMMRRWEKLLYVDSIAFFCVAFSQKLYSEIGPLDELFETGFFEDDDYCERVRLAGYQIAIAEDVFIHHHLSASFDALGEERKREIFEKSRRIYEAKWGPWRPHKYRTNADPASGTS